MTYSNDARGFALPTAIGALVIVAILVTAAFYTARQELRIGVASRNSAMALNLAQSSINNVLVNRASALTALAIGAKATISDTVPRRGVVTVDATRLAQRLYFMDATARVTEGGALWAGATRRVGLVTRLTAANMDPPAALTTVGSIKIGGSSIIDGNDHVPSGWSAACPGTLSNKPGILINDTMNITTVGTKFEVIGSPKPKAQNTTLTSEALLGFGEMTWSDLVALAEKQLGSGPYTSIAPDSTVVGGVKTCRTSTLTNFGDPRSLAGVCSNYFPIIYAPGDVKFTGGFGQGILLVEGGLEVQGGFEFYGPVFIKGELTTAGTGGHFNGGVVAANVNLDLSTVLGDALVSYSSCAVARAVLGNSALTKIRPLAQRSWVDMSSVIGG